MATAAKKNNQQKKAIKKMPPAANKKPAANIKKSTGKVAVAKPVASKKNEASAPEKIKAAAPKNEKDQKKSENREITENKKAAVILKPAVKESDVADLPKISKKSSGKTIPVAGPVIVRSALPGLRVAPGLMTDSGRRAENALNDGSAVHRLSKKEIQEIQQKLLAMQTASTTELREKLEEAQEHAIASADAVDQASDACDEDILLEIATTKDEQLQLINSALEKIDNGSYGVCIMCGEIISPTRLRLLPFVLRCKNCRDLYEKHRRRRDANWLLMNGGLAGDDTETEEVVTEE